MYRKWLVQLLHIKGTPRRTALAYAVGVFYGFSPMLGLHTILGLATAFAFRLNRVAVLLGVYSNLPWILVAYYGSATVLGALVLGSEPPRLVDFQQILGAVHLHGNYWRLLDLLHPLLWPYLVGTTIGAVVVALMAYHVAFAVLTARSRLALGGSSDTPEIKSDSVS